MHDDSKPLPPNPSKLPEPRPLPASIETIADLIFRQRAVDAWRAASKLRRLMEAWEAWLIRLELTGDADPSYAAVLLPEAILACLTVLYKLKVDIPAFRQTPIDAMIEKFPRLWEHSANWQKNPENLQRIRKCIRGDPETALREFLEGKQDWWSELLGDLLGFLHQLEIAPSIILEGSADTRNGPKRNKIDRRPSRNPASNPDQPDFNFSKWGIGFDPSTGWHVFRFTPAGWKYARKKLAVPNGVSTLMLRSLLEGKGILRKRDISNLYARSGAQPKKLNSYLTRLRRVISDRIGLVDKKRNVLPSVRGGAWQLEIRIGLAEKVDEEFSNADPEFSFRPCE